MEILEEEEDAAIRWNINIAKKRYKYLFVVLFMVQSVFLMMLGVLRLPPAACSASWWDALGLEITVAACSTSFLVMLLGLRLLLLHVLSFIFSSLFAPIVFVSIFNFAQWCFISSLSDCCCGGFLVWFPLICVELRVIAPTSMPCEKTLLHTLEGKESLLSWSL